MLTRRAVPTRTAVLALGGALAIAAAGCGGSASTKSPSGSGGSATGAAKAGGTIYYLTKRPVEHWDPQRVYIGRDISNESRLVTRTLTQFGTGSGTESNQIHPDLATDTGQASDGGKTWKFTLRTDAKWQDGTPVTCDQIKYGVSRTFATDVITGGPNYAIQFLDIPSAAKGGSVYKGPYTKVGQAEFDKSIDCTGQTITFHLKKPVGDFNYAVTLPAFAPYVQAQDKADKSNYAIFSDGPYMLQGTWVHGKGATFVRNPNWDPKSDPAGFRTALPDKFVLVEGLTTEVVFDRIIADAGNDKFAVTDRTAPPAYQPKLTAPGLKARMTNPQAPYVDYLVPNFKKLTNPKVRQALAIATDKTGYITAEGGQIIGTPAHTLISPTVLGYKDFNVFGAPDNGDPVKARQLLQQAGVQIPYPIHYTYNGGTPTADAQASAIKAGWEKAGFQVTLEDLGDTYYDVVQNPNNFTKYDIAWASWGADWPVASTVVPALFDSRVNLSTASSGQDYGFYDDSTFNAKVDDAFKETDVKKQATLWGDLDEYLANQVAYVPLQYQKFLRVHGSGVTNYVESASTSAFPDLGVIATKS